MAMNPESLILVHRGALGDFLNAWPAMLAVRSAYRGADIRFSGRASHGIWLERLNIQPCSPEFVSALDQLYLEKEGNGRTRLPPSLDRTLVVWFGLGQRPPIPEHEHILFLRGTAPGDRRTPRELYREGLGALSIGWREEYQAVWRQLHGIPSPTGGSGPVLLFPGAGHAAKRWPLVNFIELARILARAGVEPRFVLGPVEVEAGVEVEKFSCLVPGNLPEAEGLTALQESVRTAQLVVGNDCGPMHLAGLAGVPGLVLFGPTDELRWGPPALRTMSLPLSCRPCTVTTADISCPDPRCLTGLRVEEVASTVFALLART